MDAQCEQEGAEHTALGDSGVQFGGGGTANPDCLGSVCWEVQYSVTEFATQFHLGILC